MNMLLHGVKDSEFEIYHGDTLTNDWDLLRELNPAKKPYFDAIVANPPFSYRWDATDAMGDDVRFKNYGLAPNSADGLRFLHRLRQSDLLLAREHRLLRQLTSHALSSTLAPFSRHIGTSCQSIPIRLLRRLTCINHGYLLALRFARYPLLRR